ncbi:MAG: glycosyltransferase family 2 protein [Proteobacteria bacterium]|nr:glycosyltransferase family 2 protein [Pseudomonadota bacterium]
MSKALAVPPAGPARIAPGEQTAIAPGDRTAAAIRLSALVVARNEESRIAGCLESLAFADEIVVVLDRCTDGTEAVARRYKSRIHLGSWEREGDRRNLGIDACRGAWIFELDADEVTTPALINAVNAAIAADAYDIFDIPVHNYVGDRLVLNGWMAAIGTNFAARLFRKGAKTWGPERVHPHLDIKGRRGPVLEAALVHRVAHDISGLLRKLDRNTTWRALDLVERGQVGRFPSAVRKIPSRFWKCFVARKGWREGGYGFVIALCAALYPVLSHLKATLDAPRGALAGK